MASEKFPKDWLVKDMEEAEISIMTSRNRNHPSLAPFAAKSLSDSDKYRLLMRLDARFKGWAGESIIGFIARRSAGRAALSTGGADGE